MQNHYYLGMYDIADDAVRRQVFWALAAFGIHRQKSVFECCLQHEQKTQLLALLDELTQETQRRIVLLKIFPQHAATLLLGQAKQMPTGECLYIG